MIPRPVGQRPPPAPLSRGVPHDENGDAMNTHDIDNGIEALRDDLTRFDSRVRSVLRERPFVALGTMVAAGFFLGRVVGRR